MILLSLMTAAALAADARVDGELRQWQPVTLTFEGPATSEGASPNPFRDYRLDVTFTHARSGKKLTVPGYYAADGNAAESSAAAGNRWRAHFLAIEAGEWKYAASFRTGPDVAIHGGGQPTGFDGAAGSLRIAAAKGRGLLQYTGGHYLQYAGTGERFLKGGADSPENFLAYEEFDGTRDADADSGSYKAVGTFLHKYAAHVRDWKPGDPTWKGGKGKGIIGALNYPASKGMNSVYFLTYNLDGGDGRDTWMWTDEKTRDRFDASKLDQWEIVFAHMDRLGLMLHVVTQETENDRRLGGDASLNAIRKLYLRELAARYAHHRALVWNLGEENNTPDGDRKEIARYIRSLDPYTHPITVHTKNNKALTFYDGLFGDPFFEATSIQGEMKNYNAEAVALRKRSAEAGRKWAIFGDEQAPASHGVLPDADDPGHDIPRKYGLWGNLMGGGAGVEWYFGSKFAHMDINCEDWRSRDRLWDMTRHALEFFHKHLPFWEMEPANDLSQGAFVLAKKNSAYAVYLPGGGEAAVKVGGGSYKVKWYNPRTGGALRDGTVKTVKGPGAQAIGAPPEDANQDWVALLKR
jgi:hypothetical protein